MSGQASPPTALARWVAEHDDHWLFTVLYVGLAVVLSIMISLFWLVAVVAAHGALEWWALRHRGGIVDRRRALAAITWHLRLDITLVLFALWLGVYLETLFGMAGLGPLARTGAQAGARFAAWQRVLRGTLMTVDDAAQVARAMLARRRRAADRREVPFDVESDTGREGPDGARPPRRIGLGDRIVLGSGLLFAGLIIAAPWLTPHDAASLLAVLASDLHPWP